MKVRIIDGTWRTGSNAVPIKDKTFPLKREFYAGTDGRFKVGVEGTIDSGLPQRTCYIFVDKDKFEYLDEDGTVISDITSCGSSLTPSNLTVDYERMLTESETEDEALVRIRETFNMFDDIVRSVCSGIIRGLIVCGPAGVGKSYGVEQILQAKQLVQNLQTPKVTRFEMICGYASPINIYKALYNHSAEGHVVVFDDCDDALLDDTALNILKAALDTKKRREIYWLAESKTLSSEGIPNHFEFKGSVIFLTNYDFEKTTASRLRAHMDAMLSRCHYLDLAISNQRDQLLRIKQVVNDGMLREYEFSENVVAEILYYVEDNIDHFRELSLRTVKKIADFRKAFNGSWKAKVEATCLKRQARFKRLLSIKEENAIHEEEYMT